MKAIYLSAIVILLATFQGVAQGTGITHYQRKAKNIVLQFPGEKYSSEGFLIAVPDSVYSFGKITVKKPHFGVLKAKNYQLRFEDNRITNVEFMLSGKSQLDNFLTLLNANFEGKLEKTDYGFAVNMKDGKVMKCYVSKLGLKSLIRILID